MSAREALRELARLGLTARLQGTGVVVDQSPPPDRRSSPAATCTLVLDRRLAAAAGWCHGDAAVTLGDVRRRPARSGGRRTVRWARSLIAPISRDRVRLAPRRRRARCSSRSRACKADGVAFAAQARRARRAGGRRRIAARRTASRCRGSQVRDARLALALLADRFFDHPSRRMPVVGVTGTNGKTTTAYLLAAMLDAAGLSAGMLGTVAYRIGGEEREASRTTPEAPDVQQLLSEMLAAGLPLGGDGGVVARAGAEARRRHALRRRRSSPT